MLSLLVINACNSVSQDFGQFSRIQSFDENWQFFLGDSVAAVNSENWRELDLPHDWSIEGEFEQDHPAGLGGGYLPGGMGWYKKTFKIQDSSKLTSIQFDGVYMDSEVWVNGEYLGKRPNGYISFDYDLTPYLKYDGQENEILVKVDNSKQPNSRWYSGSGIYRHVWLNTTNKLHVANWGSFVTTPIVSEDSAAISIESMIENEYPVSKTATIETSILFNEAEISSTEENFSFEANSIKNIQQRITIETPQLWSIDTPNMYTAKTNIIIDGELVDSYKTPFGIRTFEFDLDKGFILNGEQLKIKGVCLHHDLGPLGAAVNTRAIERQLEIMKDMGVNGIRTAHNPPTPELLDLCDRMGFVVMDESYDMWNNTKTKYDYANYWNEWHKKDLEDFIIRDRNHPSIIIWSIGNEIQEQWKEQGVRTARELKAIVRELDTTRPITVAMNPPVNMPDANVTTQFDTAKVSLNPVAASGVLDIIGYNYAHQTYEHHQKNFPETPFIATETTSGLQTRGYYEFPSDTLKIWPVRWDIPFDGGNPDHTISAFDQVRVPWGSLHETTWKIIKKHDFLSGMFIWTGFDYIGEPTPYTWPSRSSYFGVVDLAGFPKDVYYMYQSEWTDKDVLHLLPHWNWENGQSVDVWAYYNNADEVELFVNGKSQGIRKKQGDELHVMWRIPIEAGTLKAVSRKAGKIVLEKEVHTAGEAFGLKLTPDRETINADGKDLSFIKVEIVDDKGNLVPRAKNQLNFSVEGEGKIVGVASGDPANHESFKGKTHKALNGKCLAIVQANKNAGAIELTVSGEGLKTNTISITTK
nr:beta-galactosidase GalB [Gramella oceanisediminis]